MQTTNSIKKFNIIDKCDRKMLGEGRSKGMSFAFCKKVEDTLKTVQPLSPCKDYLNDIIFIEHTGVPIKACGLDLKEKKDIFLEDTCYLLITTLPQNKINVEKMKSENSYPFPTKMLIDELIFMLDNCENIQRFMNFFEELCDIKDRTIITRKDPYLIVKLPTHWAKTTYLISMYSYLIRISLYCNFNNNPLKELENMLNTTGFHNVEIPYLSKIFRILKSIEYSGNSKFLEVQDFKSKQLKINPSSIHGTGIAAY